mmetsp:Transcript_14839/g.29133  ORF Transcript_14839/g.29133 Transcript_14839/m.29133 type:complete len:396 (-) Transcript_14839:315-1502(-)
MAVGLGSYALLLACLLTGQGREKTTVLAILPTRAISLAGREMLGSPKNPVPRSAHVRSVVQEGEEPGKTSFLVRKRTTRGSSQQSDILVRKQPRMNYRRQFLASVVFTSTFAAIQNRALSKTLYKPPEITTTSSPEAIKLAKELAKLNTVFYGAHWCSHCANQKRVLGREAFAMIRYVECAEDGVDSQRRLCQKKDIPGYPTWEIAGEQYPGEQSLEDLWGIVQDIRDSPVTSPTTQSVAEGEWVINLLYDSECPVCSAEVDFLKAHDPEGRIRYTDITDPNYDPNQPGNGGVSFEDAMDRIHAVTSNGEVVQGVEVFRRTYGAIGLGWLFSASRVPVVGSVVDHVYDTWAANRLRLTGRGDLAAELKRRRNVREAQCTDTTGSPTEKHSCPSLT